MYFYTRNSIFHYGSSFHKLLAKMRVGSIRPAQACGLPTGIVSQFTNNRHSAFQRKSKHQGMTRNKGFLWLYLLIRN